MGKRFAAVMLFHTCATEDATNSADAFHSALEMLQNRNSFVEGRFVEADFDVRVGE